MKLTHKYENNNQTFMEIKTISSEYLTCLRNQCCYVNEREKHVRMEVCENSRQTMDEGKVCLSNVASACVDSATGPLCLCRTNTQLIQA